MWGFFCRSRYMPRNAVKSDCKTADLSNWTPRPLPPETPLTGRYCRLERLNEAHHGADLANVFLSAPHTTWDYLPYGPFTKVADFQAWLAGIAAKSDPLFHAIIDAKTGNPVGLASLMRIDPTNGVIEVGHIHFGPALQRTPAATEAITLLMTRVFEELGYRRLEWKCNALNEVSRTAALRLGFTYEGTFRQAVIVKGRNRDTAWFSIIDSDWPAIRAAHDAWLDPTNFDAAGHQRQHLTPPSRPPQP
jgi:RimJ/RimL family protein N-acetyltransferase